MTKPLVETSDEEWLNLMDINLSGPFRTTRAALRRADLLSALCQESAGDFSQAALVEGALGGGVGT